MKSTSKKIPLVKENWTESDLTHQWFTKILNSADARETLELRWEKKNQNGRKDLSISFSGRERCVVEFKKPAVTDLRQHLIQAHRYGHSSNYWRDGSLVPILGVLTNGFEAIVFDASVSFQEAARTAEVIPLNNDIGLKRFEKIFSLISKGKVGHSLHKEPTADVREGAEDIVDALSKELLKYYRQFKTAKVQDAFDATLQMFLVAVLRDCGFIPTRTLQLFYESGNWAKVSELLNDMLASNFKSLPSGKHGVVEAVYQETRTLCARLDRVPPDCLGMVYESLLHKIVGGRATTSYYTPYELAKIVLSEIDPKIDETLLDPSCGSGTFLTAAIEYIATKKHHQKPEFMFEYVTKHLRGVDRDIYACQVAKAMVLAAVASHLDFDPSQRELRLPSLANTIIHEDLFLYKPKSKFDVVVGNLPWGHIDGKRKDDVLDISTRKKMGKLDKYDSFYRNVDISAIALEHIADTVIKSNGKLGLLIKQQSLNGQDSSKKFIPYAKAAGFKFWDYGQKRWFSNIASLTAVAWLGTDQKKFIVDKSGAKQNLLAQDGVLVKNYGTFHLGFQSSADSVYKRAACDSKNTMLVRELYPDDASLNHFILPKKGEKIVFVSPGSSTPETFISSLTAEEKNILKNRSQVSETNKYNWRGAEGRELYRFDGSQLRIVFQKYFNGDRLRAGIDEKGKRIASSTQVVFIPNATCPEWFVWGLLGWLNSSFLKDELIRIDTTYARANALAISTKKLNELFKIPKALNNESFGNWVKRKATAGTTPEVVESQILRLINDSSNSTEEIRSRAIKKAEIALLAAKKSSRKRG